MAKLLLLSILVAYVALPALAARERNPSRGLKRALAMIIVFNLIYTCAVMFIAPLLG